MKVKGVWDCHKHYRFNIPRTGFCPECRSDARRDAAEKVRPALAAESKPEISERGAGLKFDGGKPQWNLLMEGMPYGLEQVVAILTFGAKKYSAHSWRQVENGRERYLDALYRHLHAHSTGELVDPESGLPHLAHAITNLLFVIELEKPNVSPSN